MLKIAGLIVAVYLGLGALLFFFQRALIYFPQPRALDSRATMMSLQIDGAEVLVSTRAHHGPKALIYFGGNAEDVSYNLPGFAAAFPDHAIYLMHYRGFGDSSGKPSEAALFADALVLFDRVHAGHTDIVVVGRSLGSGVALYLASQRPVDRLVLVTPYDSILELAARQFPVFPVRWFLKDKFESWKYAQQLVVPTLVIAAEHDDVIPRARTEALLTHFQPGVAKMKVLAGTGHNTISDSPAYFPLLQATP